MKIGVITWFKYNNYGTKLQALALQMFLKEKGYNPELINFQLDDSINKKRNKMTSYEFFCKVLKKFVKLINYKKINQKESKMSNIIIDNCKLSSFVNNEKDYINLCNSYDYLLFGSDQIWNPTWFHPYYFADYNSIKTKRISYAPSIGVKKISKDLVDNYKNALSKFDSIAMREKNGCEIVQKLINKKVQNVLDPVFLLDKEEWKKFESNEINIDRPYILCYLLTDNKNHWKAIKKYAKDNRKKLVVIPVGGYSYFSSKYVIPACDASIFLKLFDNCDEVITDSFHGTVFSLIYNKKMTVFERHNPKSSHSENDRIVNILDMVDLMNRFVHYNSKKIECVGKVDFKTVNKIIGEKIKESKKYIENSLR